MALKSILIACETLREELEKLIQSLGLKTDIVWMNGGLHASPENLQKSLQAEINKHDGFYDDIILAYGFCGGGLENLETQTSSLIIPKAEDCISILIGGDHKRSQVNDRDKPLFITKGWVRSFNQMEGLNIKSIKKKYGDELAKDLYKQICNGYCNIDIINTGAYCIKEIDEDVTEIQDALEIPCKTINGNLALIEKLLKKEWDDDIIVKGPGQKIERSDYYE
ncbi:MAG: DUF1638 domain-containing protein [Desulfobacterales bacterium]|nr:DUF1638 domain-containing protein [Desulfobacterales bacterium]